MEGDAVVVDEPLPAPVGPVMFLEQPPAPAAAPAAADPVPAAPPSTDDTQPSSSTQVQQSAAEVARPQPPQPPAAAPAAAPQQHQQQQQQLQAPGMTRLEQETCLAMHSILAKYKEADPFRQPVDVDALNIPDYLVVIKKPMDLKTVREKVRSGVYKSMQEWRADLQLIWDNAKKYNGEGHPVTLLATKLQAQVERRMPDALEVAKANLTADGRGEARPRKNIKPRNVELQFLASSQPGSSDTDSMDEGPAAAAAAAASAAAVRRSPEVLKVAVKRERDADAAAGRPAKRRLPVGAAAAGGGGANQGLDLDALTTMLNTPLARQLGAEEPDDLAFLALWKRFMNRKQQLLSAAADSEPLRIGNQQLRAHLATAQDSMAQLQERLREENAARQAAVGAKEALEERLAEVQREKEHWEREYNQQKTIMEAQRDLLEQQQTVLRKLAAQKQAQLKSD